MCEKSTTPPNRTTSVNTPSVHQLDEPELSAVVAVAPCEGNLHQLDTVRHPEDTKVIGREQHEPI